MDQDHKRSERYSNKSSFSRRQDRRRRHEKKRRHHDGHSARRHREYDWDDNAAEQRNKRRKREDRYSDSEKNNLDTTLHNDPPRKRKKQDASHDEGFVPSATAYCIPQKRRKYEHGESSTQDLVRKREAPITKIAKVSSIMSLSRSNNFFFSYIIPMARCLLFIGSRWYNRIPFWVDQTQKNIAVKNAQPHHHFQFCSRIT